MSQFFTIPIRSDRLTMTFSVKANLASRKTEYQSIDVFDTDVFGKVLTLDGHIQLTTLDERAYHEGLVQIPLLNLPNAKTALVIGGGDGGVIREICRHPGIERVDMVEIDAGVVEVCREFMPELSDGAFNDPRVNLHIADAFPFVKQAEGPYDLIVVDSTDVYEEEDGSLSQMLFTDAFYTDIKRLLAPEGLVVTQADNLVFCPYSMDEALEMLGRVFPAIGSYQAIVPSFGGFSGYCYASHGKRPAADWSQVSLPSFELKYLNPVTYALAFNPLRFG